MSIRTGFVMLAITALAASDGCARLPYTSTTIHQDQLVQATLQQEVEPAGYTHPVRLRADQVAALLRGFSLRAEQRVPLPWFAEEEPPQKMLRDDEIARLSPFLVEAFQKAGPEERIHFSLSAPGMNRADAKTVTSGWLAVRDPYLYITIEYYHTEMPIRSSDRYLPNNPQMPPLPGSFLLFFEPGRFWSIDRSGVRALEYREFLKSASAGRSTP
jgi:hypothetical protein